MFPGSFPQTGGCHCKTLRFQMSAPPANIYACHCTDCQTLSGSAFGIGVVVAESSFTLSGTPRLVQRILGSGRTGTRWTCGDCGVWICGNARPNPTTGIAHRIIRGGTFDDTSWIKPMSHVWARSAQPWVVFPPGARVYATGADDR